VKILCIPDCQVKPGVDTSYLTWIGNYIVAKKPDVIVNLGDFADMPSLSSYDVGHKSFEGRRYKADIEAAIKGMQALLEPLSQYNDRMRKTRHAQYVPRLVGLYGNHEQRIVKAIDKDSKLDGTLSLDDLKYKEFGWEMYDFLEVVIIEGVAFSHYFTSGQLGRPVASAVACLNRKHMSCIQGHQQGLQIATGHRADGNPITCVIAGSCYLHNEDYLGPQGNKHWRGIIMLHAVSDGAFDIMPVSLEYLKTKYANT
jgi:hypothetical protein